ncbi:MAG: endolytic transglycosylase MltG [Thermoflexales bacterium]|nr:endolytic transglycosylase MltG [Thermoflexales bacterium]
MRRKRKTLTSALIFLVTLLVLFGMGGVLWTMIGRQSTAGGQPGSVQIPAPSRIEDVFIAAYLNWRASDLSLPAGKDGTPVTFAVQSGESVGQVATRLQREGLISDAELFRLYLRYNGLDSSVEAGQFQLNETMTMAEVAAALQRGRRDNEISLTVPEGRRLEEVAQLVAQQSSVNADEFLALALAPQTFSSRFSFLAELPPDATLEGYLFPDTYRFDEDATAHDVIERMLSTLEAKLPPGGRDKLRAQGRTLFEALALASIVEREAVVADEHPVIAGVYYNRLLSGMSLDADPTVQYAMGYQPAQNTWWNRELTIEDYRAVISPYNTYLNPGLPPGPICSPGMSALSAAIEPAQVPYYFFRASCSGDGTHMFSKTLEEHAAKGCQ